MSDTNNELVIPEQVIKDKIYLIRGAKVMLDKDLSELYGVATRVLKQAVRRNKLRFPEDFMFELSKEEYEDLRSQIVISSWGGTRYLPMAFTEQGVAMLSSILNTERAIKVNIQIIRIFTKLREMILNHTELLLKVSELETRVVNQDQDIQKIFTYLKELIPPQTPPRKRIGFKTGNGK